MFFSKNSLLPAQLLFTALAYTVFLSVMAVFLALQSPWLGLVLKNDSSQITVIKSVGPSETVPNNAVLEAISYSLSGLWIELVPTDLMEEPDLLPDYAELDEFFARQEMIADVLSKSAVAIRWRTAESEKSQVTIIQPTSRPLSSLPLLFWFQVFVCSLGCLIATWVWVLQPRDMGARMFGITGLLFPAFVLPAAVYSSRELALDGQLFFALSSANHLGSLMFGSAFAGIFMTHPLRLVTNRKLHTLFAIFGLWWVAHVSRLAPNLDLGFRAAIISLLLISVWFGIKQLRQSKGKPIERASLRWLGLSLLIGSSLYIFLFMASALLGWLPPVPQGYAFGFFLLIYIGIALGVGRYRLFELDIWSYRLLLWIAATIAVVALDAALIMLLDWSEGLALGVSLWLCGVMYFPVRQWLWQKFVSRNMPALTTLLPELLIIAFSGTDQKRMQQWQQLLIRLYAPLKIEVSNNMDPDSSLREDGTGLMVPPCAGIPAFEMRYRSQGRQLFSTADVGFVDALVTLMNKAEAARLSREQGAIEERRRIASDIHDDVGARLLMLIHSSENPKQADLARSAMSDLRSALANLDGESVLLVDALADWRDEANQRCDAAKVKLDWQSPTTPPTVLLAPRIKTILERALRESLTNALKHGDPEQINVRITHFHESLKICVEHDGLQTDPATWVPGLGMKSLNQRLAACGGSLHSCLTPHRKTEVVVSVPLGTV